MSGWWPGLHASGAGAIEINGKRLSAKRLAGCRAYLVLVSQQTVVFKNSVAPVNAFSANARFAEVAHIASLDEVFSVLPERSTV